MLAGALAAYIVGIEIGQRLARRARRRAPAGALLALVHAFMVLTRGANQIATGLVVTFLGIGLTALFGQDYVGQGVNAFAVGPDPRPVRPPVLRPDPVRPRPADVPGDPRRADRLAGAVPHPLRPDGSGRGRAPRGARRLRHVGDARSATSPRCSAVRSPASAAPSCRRRSPCNWSENMTVGRGFVAVSLVIFAAWNPMKAIIGAYLFSGAIALQLYLQAAGHRHLAVPAPGGAVPRRHRDPGGRSADGGPTRAPSRSAGSSDRVRAAPADIREPQLNQSPQTGGTMTTRRTRAAMLPGLLALALVAAACGSDDDSSDDASTDDRCDATARRPTPARPEGSRRRARHGRGRHRRLHLRRPEGRLRIQPGRLRRAATRSQEAFPDLEVLQAENVPETAESEAVMQGMIDDGADLIFATSYGHLEFAANLAAANPDVVFVHQGGLEAGASSTTSAPTSARCTSRCTWPASPPVRSSETGKLGYVYAFPIPQTLANINAFTLGAQSVNPDIETIAVSTGSWCDPALQAQAAQSLIDAGRRRDHAAPGLHEDDRRGGRSGRRVLGRLPRRRLRRSPRTAGSPARSGTGRPCTPTSCRR